MNEHIITLKMTTFPNLLKVMGKRLVRYFWYGMVTKMISIDASMVAIMK